MITIYKYTLNVGADNTFDTARILRVVHVAPDYSEEWKTAKEFGIPRDPGRARREQIEAERVNVWCEVDTEGKETASFVLIGTGHPAPRNGKHYGTAVMPSGLVWHVYGNPYWGW